MMPKENHSYVSSSTVKEVAGLGGRTADFVPPPVQRALALKFGQPVRSEPLEWPAGGSFDEDLSE
jgi:hypothetical protein